MHWHRPYTVVSKPNVCPHVTVDLSDSLCPFYESHLAKETNYVPLIVVGLHESEIDDWPSLSLPVF